MSMSYKVHNLSHTVIVSQNDLFAAVMQITGGLLGITKYISGGLTEHRKLVDYWLNKFGLTSWSEKLMSNERHDWRELRKEIKEYCKNILDDNRLFGDSPWRPV